MKTSQSSNRWRPRDINTNGVNGVNGTGSLGRSSRKKDNVDPAYLSPYKDHFAQGLNGSRSGSEPDSLLDLYNNRGNSAGKSAQEAMPEPVRSDHHKEPQEQLSDEAPADIESGWIHREKLLQIEKKEMQELGITPPPAPRTHSRSKSRRARDRSLDNINGEPEQEQEIRSAKEGKRRRIQSPIQQEHEPEEIPIDHDLDTRLPNEQATEAQLERPTSPIYRQHKLRSSSSRIPLPRSSPMPMPKDGIDRTTPHKRTRSSGEKDITYPGTRSRNNSLNSTNILAIDDTDHTKTPPSTSRPGSASTSPPKPRTSSLPRKASLHNRQPSNPLSPSYQKTLPQTTPLQKARTTSTPTARSPSTSTPPTIRPKSRQGLEARPPTAINRPEGDPPWLKEMYKPDPRLPPDQQMLPTHAKRLQQEQWEQARKASELRQHELGKSSASEKARVREAEKQDDSGSDDATKREKWMQSQRAFSPLAVHTRNGLVSSREGGRVVDSREGTTERDKGGGGTWLSSPSETSVGEKREKNTYSPLPPLPKESATMQGLGGSGQGGQGPAGSVGGGPKGLRKGSEKQGPLDPFEKEKMGRMEDERVRRESRGNDGAEEKNGKDGKAGKEVGCTCCCVM